MSAVSTARATKALLLAGRLALGGVFLYAAYTKLRQPWMLFAMSVDSYHLLPDWALPVVARTLPWAELVLGVLLVAGYKLRYVAAAASALLLLFFGVMLRSYYTGLTIDCGCFGLGEALSPKTLARDGILALVSLLLTGGAFVSARKQRAREARETPEPAAP